MQNQPSGPQSSGDLIATAAASAVDRIRHDVAPVADELRQEAAELARAVAGLTVSSTLAFLSVQIGLLSLTAGLARHSKRLPTTLAVSGALLAGAAITAAYARRHWPRAIRLRVLERLAAALRSPVRSAKARD